MYEKLCKNYNIILQIQLLNIIEMHFTEIFTLRIRLFNEKVGIITNKVKQIQQSTQSKSVVTEEILLQKSKQYDY